MSLATNSVQSISELPSLLDPQRDGGCVHTGAGFLPQNCRVCADLINIQNDQMTNPSSAPRLEVALRVFRPKLGLMEFPVCLHSLFQPFRWSLISISERPRKFSRILISGKEMLPRNTEKKSQTQNDRSVVRPFIPESLHLEGPVLNSLGLKAGCLHNASSSGVFKGLCEVMWVWLCVQSSVGNSTALRSFMEAGSNLKLQTFHGSVLR